MPIKNIALTPLLALALCASLCAAETRYLLTPEETILAQIPPPPADDSPAGMADIEVLLQMQKDRTPAQIERATHVATHTPMQMGASVFGPDFTAENLPRTSEILLAITAERREVVLAAKRQWNRVRPYDRGLGIDPCVYRPRDSSYPSGHSAAAATWAVIYSAAFPEYTTLFENEMRETMWCRVLGGAHYPSDTQAGKLLGAMVAREILKHQPGQDCIREIRAEVAAFLKKHPQAVTHARERLAEIARTPLRVVSYNIRIGRGMDNQTDLRRTADVLRRLEADVILLQEVDVNAKRSGNVDQAAELARLLGMHHYFAKALDRSGGKYGNAILSKLPFASTSTIALPGGSEQRSAGIVEIVLPRRGATKEEAETDAGAYRIIAVSAHLDHKVKTTHLEHIAKISKEVDRLLANRPASVAIFGGDFNLTEASPVWGPVRKAHDWAVPRKDPGASKTFRADNPKSEIDWFLYKRGATKAPTLLVTEYKAINEPMASDHLPLVFEIKLIGGK